MKSIKNVRVLIPRRGPMTWEAFAPWISELMRDELRLMDFRDPQQEPIYNRNATLPALTTHIGDTGRASSQRLLPLLSSANKQSTQSAQPLTATDAGSNATISIAAHSVQYGFGTIAFNSGSITGLAYSTVYFVYADDPTYAGGAVTYFATTNANLVTANDGRYYLGKITTPAGGGGPSGGGWGGGGGGGGSQIP